jgi:integrase
VRREIGNADKLPLADARMVAREWLRQVELGIDPRAKQREEKARQQHTFELVAKAWFKEAVARMANAEEIERAVTFIFVNRWRGRPIASITTIEIRDIVKRKAQGLSPAPGAKKQGPAPAQAGSILGFIKRLFTWAIDQHIYGLEKNPADALRGERLIGPKVRRKRVLSDEELRSVWNAATKLDYPYRDIVHMLILTGQRRSEVAAARWCEFDLKQRLWTISAERMKTDTAHVVPITDSLMTLLSNLPRFAEGDHLFSNTFGERSVAGFSKCKSSIDRLVPLPHWTLHDLRRTMRTNLSALPIPDRVRELMIAHAQPGLHQVYDQYSYLAEKTRGFEAWHARLNLILRHETDNVVALRK